MLYVELFFIQGSITPQKEMQLEHSMSLQQAHLATVE